MLVRSWNLFHGNSFPPGRTSYLEEMVMLASADRPDVLAAVAGFAAVTVDPRGFRSGALNEALPESYR